MRLAELRKTNISAEEAEGDCVISDCYVGVWENEKEVGEKTRGEKDKATRVLDILFETLPLSVWVPRGFEIGFT